MIDFQNGLEGHKISNVTKRGLNQVIFIIIVHDIQIDCQLLTGNMSKVYLILNKM